MTNVLDFNAALTEKELADYLASNEFDPDRKSKVLFGLNNNVESFIAWLFPAAVITPKYACIGNVHGSPGTSLKIETRGSKQGVWADFADPDQKGGNLIDLYMAARDVPFRQALDDLAEWVGHGTRPEINYQREQAARKAKRFDRELGPVKGEWHYADADGVIIASVYRYEPEPGSKEFLPWDAVKRRYGNPDVRPLYNLPGVLKSSSVVVVEGEKAADALIAQDITATAVMGGCNSPLERTDLEPLRGKDVTIWPDNDEPGRKFAASFALAIQDIAASVRIIEPPADVPKGWDAADAVDEGRDVGDILGHGGEASTQTVLTDVLGFDIFQWSTGRFLGKAPEITWLCEGTIPQGVPALFAAMGGVGKSFIALDLALEIASAVVFDYNDRRILGGKVAARGSVVILNAEDGTDSIHRRLERIDPDNRRERADGKVFIVPMPEVGGPMPLVTGDRGEFKKTPQFNALIAQLKCIPDLKLVIIDPLQAFVTADITKDPAAGQYMWSAFAQICAETGATVIACHHMRKEGMSRIDSADSAREAIRGSTALIDGARATYALWNASEDQSMRICAELNLEYQPKRVVNGAVVKSNDEHDWEVHTYVRADSGLLEDRTVTAQGVRTATEGLTQEQIEECMDEIDRRWRRGSPFSASAQSQDRYLVMFIQRRFGLSKKAAREQVEMWIANCVLATEMFDRKTKKTGLKVAVWPC